MFSSRSFLVLRLIFKSLSHFEFLCMVWGHVLLLLLLPLLSRFSRVRLFATPETAAHQAPLSLRFSRQEHWSGLPFPSTMHESEKWKWSRSVMSNSYRSHGLQPTRLLRPWDFPDKSIGVGSLSLLQWIFLTQESNWGLSHCRQILYQLSYTGKPSHNLIWANIIPSHLNCAL